MKKFFALLLAAMMILSCATAMAASDTIVNDDAPAWDDDSTMDGADIDVFDSVQYTGGKDEYGKTGSMATELWLQVDATGQIDVTVPLVLVFQTNIDGGEATSPSTYKITNNSTADLVVTAIDVTKVGPKNGLGYDNQPMDLVAWPASDTIATEDTYAAKLTVPSANKGKGNSSDDVVNNGVYDLSIGNHHLARWNGGLFELAKAEQDSATNKYTGKDTAIDLSMVTGPLTFVTSREAGTDGDVMDLDKGVQLLTIKYTVAIDTSDAIGEFIAGANGNDGTDGNKLTDAGTVVDVTNDGSGTVPAGNGKVVIKPQTPSDAKEDEND